MKPTFLSICVTSCLLALAAPVQAQPQWTAGTSGAIYYNGGNVGIGTPGSPTTTLDVNGTIRSSVTDGQIRLTNSLAFREFAVNSRTVVRVMPYGSISAVPSALEFFGTDYIGDPVNFERLSIRSKGSTDLAYLLFTDKGGSGAVRPLQITTGANIGVFIDSTGNVGIGKTTPGFALDVHGSISADQVINATYGTDVAEWVPSGTTIAAGTVVILDPRNTNQVIPSGSAYDTTVAGVISTEPGMVLGHPGDKKSRVATLGRVPVRVDATKHPIHIGDLLVTSDKPGTAMVSEPVDFGGVKLHRPGTLIGKALQPLDGGEGTILVLLSLQ